MAKVTSKLQVTVPKALAERYGIEPGNEIEWEAAGDVIRVVPMRKTPRRDLGSRLRLFDLATERVLAAAKQSSLSASADRGWSREDLYDRDRAR